MNDIEPANQPMEFEADAAEAGLRLDVFLAGRLEDVSRNVVQTAIKAGRVTVNSRAALRPSRAIAEGDRVTIALPPAPTIDLKPEPIPLEILYQDEHVLVVNKPVGLVVHPAPGHSFGTLVNAVLYHCSDFQRPTGDDEHDDAAWIRPGIVHRLDRDTSGVMVVAKTALALDKLGRQAREHTFERRYIALVKGEFKEEAGVIRAPIGRSNSDRKKMGIHAPLARDAVTHYRVLERYGVASLVALELETGRTHQIRVHMRYVGRPVLGDPLYGVTDYTGWEIPTELRTALKGLKGQALHAELLGFDHPVTGERLRFSAPPPPEFAAVRAALENYRAVNSA